MADKIKIATVTALAQRLAALEIGVWEIAEVNHIRVAEHGAQLHQISLMEDMPVQTLPAFKVEALLRIFIQVPGIPPTGTGSMPEAKGQDLFHRRHKERKPRQLLISLRCQRTPHGFGNDFKCLRLTFPVLLQNFIESNGSQNLRNVLVIALIAPLLSSSSKTCIRLYTLC